jgi:hypothetical protein
MVAEAERSSVVSAGAIGGASDRAGGSSQTVSAEDGAISFGFFATVPNAGGSAAASSRASSAGAANQLVWQRAQRTIRPAAPKASGATRKEVSQEGQLNNMAIHSRPPIVPAER